MRQILKFAAAALGFGVLIGVGVAVKLAFDTNDWIDRCADETSGRFISDEATRSTACKAER